MCGVITAAISARPSPSRSAAPTGLSQRLAVPIARDCARIASAPPSIPTRARREPASRRLMITSSSTAALAPSRTHRGARSSDTSSSGSCSAISRPLFVTAVRRAYSCGRPSAKCPYRSTGAA